MLQANSQSRAFLHHKEEALRGSTNWFALLEEECRAQRLLRVRSILKGANVENQRDICVASMDCDFSIAGGVLFSLGKERRRNESLRYVLLP